MVFAYGCLPMTRAPKKKTGRSGGRPVSKAALQTFQARVTALAGPVLSGMGLELVRTQAPLAGGRPVIRLFIDRPGGAVSLDDCAAVSRALEAALEAEEAAEEEAAEAPDGYVLEVSSPGLDRPLLKAEDCLRFQGRLARLKLRGGVYRGRLTRSETGGLALAAESGRVDFDWAEVVSARLIVE